MNAPASAQRQIFLDADWPFHMGEWQMNYLDYRTWRLIPSTELYLGGALAYRVDALGCKGEELVEGAPVVAFFGDSHIHGAGLSFPERVRIPGTQPLNAAVEGMLTSWIVDRFLEVRDRVPMVAAAVHTGWHNLLYNETGEEYWAAQLDRVQGPPVIAHFKLVSDYVDAVAEAGYDSVLARAPDYVPAAWSAVDPRSPESIRAALALIGRFNRFIEDYCRDRGRVLIDLGPTLAPRSLEEVGLKWIDPVHPAQGAYDEAARAVEQQLGPAVQEALKTYGRVFRMAPARS